MSDAAALDQTGTVRSTQLRPLLRTIDAVGTALLGGGKRRPIKMEALRRAAERKIGFSDWGLTPDYERGAELLEKDMFDHPAGFIGRLVTADTLRRHQENRLRLRKAIAAPAPGMGFKQPPYIITGLYRCGTTLLHHLVSAVPGRDFVPMYELMCPVPEPGREADAKRTARAGTFFAAEQDIVHPVLWDGPEECWFIMATTMRANSFGVVLDAPSYVAWLDECDMLEPYLEYRAALEYLSSFRDGGLVMKGPAHTPCLSALHRAIPEARVVFLHRDPATSVSSYCSLSAVHHRTFYGSYDAESVGEKIVERFSHFMDAAMDQRPDVPDEQILDVYYHDLVDDPVGTVRRIGEHFGDEWSEEAEKAVKAKLESLPRNKNGKHHYSASQWGLTADGIRERFAEYLRDHDVRRESC